MAAESTGLIIVMCLFVIAIGRSIFTKPTRVNPD